MGTKSISNSGLPRKCIHYREVPYPSLISGKYGHIPSKNILNQVLDIKFKTYNILNLKYFEPNLHLNTREV